jgi:hypothetical protein
MNDISRLEFVVVHNNGSQENPWSLLVLRELRGLGCETTILNSPDNGESMVGRNEKRIILFDRSTGVNRWSPCSCFARGIPDWGRRMSDECVAIGKRAVGNPKIVWHTATQILRRFCGRPQKNNGWTGDVWEKLPTSLTRLKSNGDSVRRRRAWRANFSPLSSRPLNKR